MTDDLILEVSDTIINKMSMLQVQQLCKLLSERLDIPMGGFAAAPAAAPAAAGTADAPAAAKTDFKVSLTSCGGSKIAVIKVVKDIKKISLLEAKNLVESLPAVLAESAKDSDAQDIKKLITEAGGEVNIE